MAAAASVLDLDSNEIRPNEYGDWLNQRQDNFTAFMPLRGDDAVFHETSLGVSTNRDSWMVNSSQKRLRQSVVRLATAYNTALANATAVEDIDSAAVSWSRALRNRYAARRPLPTDEPDAISSTYRPFYRQWLATTPELLEARGSTTEMFALPDQIAMSILRPNDRTPFAVLMIDAPTNLNYFMDAGQVFPRWRARAANDGRLFGSNSTPESNVTTKTLQRFQEGYGPAIEADDIFFYIYGLLHSHEYRDSYAADLKKTLPRVPLVADPAPFIEAGRELSELHLGFESADPYPLEGLAAEPTGDPYDFFAVQKMAFAKKRNLDNRKLEADNSKVTYNSQITLSGIPKDAYRYMLGSRSAIEWIIDRYRVRTDTDSGIVNDPNDWSREIGNPRYIIDLLARIVTVSLRTMQIVDSLPDLAIREDQGLS